MEMVELVDDPKTSQSNGGRRFPNFEMLDAKIASALKEIIMNPNFRRKVSREEQKAQMEDRFLRGRQIAYMIYEYFRATGAHEHVLDCTDLFGATLQGDDIQDIDTRWDQVLSSTSGVPKYGILESLYKMRTRESLINSEKYYSIVRAINQSRSIKAELPEAEDDGEETYGSKDQDTKLSSQKRKN